MNDSNDRLGLLLIFDCIGVILTTFGAALVLSMMSGGIDTNVLIISCFFVGIKILIMGIGDITGLARRFWVAAIFILLADVLVVAIDVLMSFGITSRLMMITAGLDVVIVIVSHLLWQKFFGIPLADLKEKKDWLNNRDGDYSEKAEIDDIFSALSNQDEDEAALDFDQGSTQEEDLYQELDEADREDAQSILSETMEEEDALIQTPVTPLELPEEKVLIDDSLFEGLKVSSDTGIIDSSVLFEEEPTDVPEEEDEKPAEEEDIQDVLFESEDLDEEAQEDGLALSEDTPEETADAIIWEVPKQPEVVDDQAETVAEDLATPALEEETTEEPEEPTAQTPETVASVETIPSADLIELESRLGALMTEVGTANRDTTNLSKAVNSFKAELNQLDPLVDDAAIVTTGAVVRQKLQHIVDKQYLVDEVLDDLIRLSQQINTRIDDLDAMEERLNKRQEALERKENIYGQSRTFEYEDAEIEVLPDEVILDSGDSEIIIDEGDLDALKAYLSQHPEI